jgi:2-iminobutanoate/2-iminopropanoate deaminase
MATTKIETSGAPRAIGPYAQGLQLPGGLVFCSGQIGLEPSTGAMVDGGVEAQAARALGNLAAVLEAAGGSLRSVVKTTVYLVDMGDFAAVNEVYAEAFGDHRPARAAVEVSRLPKDAAVEIEAIAWIPPK